MFFRLQYVSIARVGDGAGSYHVVSWNCSDRLKDEIGAAWKRPRVCHTDVVVVLRLTPSDG